MSYCTVLYDIPFLLVCWFSTGCVIVLMNTDFCSRPAMFPHNLHQQRRHLSIWRIWVCTWSYSRVAESAERRGTFRPLTQQNPNCVCMGGGCPSTCVPNRLWEVGCSSACAVLHVFQHLCFFRFPKCSCFFTKVASKKWRLFCL